MSQPIRFSENMTKADAKRFNKQQQERGYKNWAIINGKLSVPFKKWLKERESLEDAQVQQGQLFNPLTGRMLNDTPKNRNKIIQGLQVKRTQNEEKELMNIGDVFQASNAQRRDRTFFPFTRLQDFVEQRISNKAQPFELKLISSVGNIHHTFKFNNFHHFHGWWKGIIEDNIINQDSLNVVELSSINDHKNVFSFVRAVVSPVVGGCNKHAEKTWKTIKGTYFTFDVYNPVGQGNNCGFKCLENITGEKLKYIDERQKYGVEMNQPISVEVIGKIYQQYDKSGKTLKIINKEAREVDETQHNYIMIEKNHYYVVKKVKAHKISEKHVKRGYLYWDIETRKTEEAVRIAVDDEGNTKTDYKLKDAILCAYYRDYKTAEYQRLTFTTNSEVSACRQFIDWLHTQALSNHFYHCVAHNGSRFDMYFLLSNLTLQETEESLVQLRGTAVIDMTLFNHTFKDSCCFIVNSLKNICKSYGVEKCKQTTFVLNGETITNEQLCFYRPELTFKQFLNLQNDEPEYWKLYTDYCMIDCEALCEVWDKFREQTNKLIEKMGPFLLATCRVESTATIGSLAKKIVDGLNRNGKAHKLYLQFLQDEKGGNDADKYEYLKNFKRGGISHCHQPGKHVHPVVGYDITSQYPASMVQMYIPVGRSTWTTQYEPKRYGFYHIRNVEFDSPYVLKPVASKLESGVLNWNNNSIDELYVDSWMIQYLQQHYGLVCFDVVKGLTSDICMKGEKLFSTYVMTLFREKAEQDELKKLKKHNPAYRETVKLFLNAVTGKFVEDPSRYFSVEFVPTFATEADGPNPNHQNMNGVEIEKTQKTKKINPWIIAGVMIYSYSKRLLFDYVRCLPNNSDDIIHIETDGLYFDARLIPEFEKNVSAYEGEYPVKIGDKLGNVKQEKISDGASYFLGKKFYYMNDGKDEIMKIKGIPLKTIDEHGRDVQLVSRELYEQVYNWKKGDAPITRTFNSLKKNLYNNTYIATHEITRTINPAGDYREYN